MKVLLTGHRGYIGAVMGPVLQSAGHDVIGLDIDLYRRCDFGGKVSELPEINKDLRDVTATDLEGFDAVVHFAALSNDPLGSLDPRLTYEINHEASVRLAELAKERGVGRFVFSSSCSAYGAAGDVMHDETAALNPVTAYADSKVLVERDLNLMADDRFSPTCLRNATAYGVSSRIRLDVVLNDLVASAVTTGKVHMKSDGTPWRPIVHIRDIAAAVNAVLAAPRDRIHNEIFNVGVTDQNYRISELAEIVAATVPGSRIEYAADAGPDKRCYRLNFGKIERQLPEFRPQWDARKGAQELYAAYQNEGLKPADMQEGRYVRLREIQRLVENGLIDTSLRHRSQTVRSAVVA